MSVEPQHWIATDEGGARAGNEDAFLWLGDAETGGNGALWIVVDGEGGRGVGDLAAAMVVVTVSELYGELIATHRDPVHALRVALEEAHRRLGVIGRTYTRLAGVRASYAAVAQFEGKLYPVVSGSAAALVVTPGGVRRVGERDVARHARGDGDRDPVPNTGVGADVTGDRFHTVGEAIDPTLTSIVLCTDGITELVPDGLVAQAAERLAPRDAVEGLIEVARRRWSDDDATVAVIRFVDPNLQANTTLRAFLDWADSGLTKWPDQTLVLQIGGAVATDPPPRTNVEAIPAIEGEAAADGADPGAAVGTLAFSKDDVRAIVEASEKAADAPAAPASEDAAAPKPGDWSTQPTGPDAPGPVETAPSDPAPVRENTGAKGTLFFSPQDLAQVRAAAEAPREAPEPARAPVVDRTLDLAEDAPSPAVTRDFDVFDRDTSGDSVATTRRGHLTEDELAVTRPNPWGPVLVIAAFVLVGAAIWWFVLR